MTGVTTIPKVWGREEIWANTDLYCGKFLCFEAGMRSSLHFHEHKDESWLVMSGLFQLELREGTMVLRPGDTVRLKPGDLHRLGCIEEGMIVEVSTHDDPDDCRRLTESGPLPADQRPP